MSRARWHLVQVNDLMSRRGWHLSPLQHPPAVHMCFTAQHVEVVPDLLKVRSRFRCGASAACF